MRSWAKRSLYRGIGQDRVVDHLGVAVALRLHGRGAEAELGVLVRPHMVLQDFYPGAVEAPRRARAAAIVDDVLEHADDGGLALVVGALPFLVDGAELMPIAALDRGPVLGIGRRAVGEGDDPVLQQIPLGIGLNVDGHVLVMRRLAPLGLEVIVFSALRSWKMRRTRRAGLGRMNLFCRCTHGFAPLPRFGCCCLKRTPSTLLCPLPSLPPVLVSAFIES